ncbi:MAG: hypothetical protein SPG10_17270 [Enterocloster clostridioformis]|nr:hypothetical protein [Enterocloster clostridioformis]
MEKFSLYAVLPEGLLADLDNQDVIISGSGTQQGGGSTGSFLDHATISLTEYNGKTMVVADFDFSSVGSGGGKHISKERQILCKRGIGCEGGEG